MTRLKYTELLKPNIFVTKMPFSFGYNLKMSKNRIPTPFFNVTKPNVIKFCNQPWLHA